MGGCGLRSTDVNFLQEIVNKLNETNAESKQLELRQQVAHSKGVRERSMSQ